MGKNKPSAIRGLSYLVKRGIEVVLVVAPPRTEPGLGGENLCETARSFGIPSAADDELYQNIDRLKHIDLVISFLFWKKIKKPLIDAPKIGCINFHPAPLPDFRGVGGYNAAIYENLPSWGVSAHFVNESFDTGDIIKVKRFTINPRQETAFSLEQKSQRFLINLFKEVINMICDAKPLPRTSQGKGRYIRKQDFERMRNINPKDSLEDIERKIRAFWYPPYIGASVEIKGETFTLINEKLLKEIGRLYQRKHI
ncbi:MAG: formyl transferase [Candidatus Portnoybacteria bacterium]|nr:formyl transferase [Candidatus Portnoybacteria bacterium]